MEFSNGVNVVAADGKQAGSLKRVVINPETKEITHVVVHRGLLANEDKVIPIEFVDTGTPEKITLTCTSDDLKTMSPLEVKQFAPNDAGGSLDQPSGGIYAQVPSERNVLKETIRTIPDELVVLKEGSAVISDDEKHVGNIEKIFADSGKITHFIATQGLLIKAKKPIPIEWVKMISDEEVKLTVGSEQVVAMGDD